MGARAASPWLLLCQGTGPLDALVAPPRFSAGIVTERYWNKTYVRYVKKILEHLA